MISMSFRTMILAAKLPPHYPMALQTLFVGFRKQPPVANGLPHTDLQVSCHKWRRDCERAVRDYRSVGSKSGALLPGRWQWTCLTDRPGNFELRINSQGLELDARWRNSSMAFRKVCSASGRSDAAMLLMRIRHS